MKLPRLKPRDPEAHKGDFGRALIIGGSRGMTGAPSLAGSAALRAGAGLVSVAVPNRCLESVAAYDPNYMTIPVADSQGRFSAAGGPQLMEIAKRFDSIGMGPGMSLGEDISRIVESLYQEFVGPMVVDADALNALAALPNGIPIARGPRILTPHIGEFRRLIGNRALSPADCRQVASSFAAKHHAIVVVKGSRTLVTDGVQSYENVTGNAGMATGGSGDVLTGVTTGLLGQSLTPFEATVLGVHIHGLAGDIARDQFGEVSMVAENIKDCVANAFQRFAEDVP